MHLIVLGMCCCSACLIKASLQWLWYSPAPNVLNLYNKSSQTIKIELNPNFLASYKTGRLIIAGSLAVV